MPPHWKCAKSTLQQPGGVLTCTSMATSSHFARFVRTGGWNLDTHTQIPADPMVAVFTAQTGAVAMSKGHCAVSWGGYGNPEAECQGRQMDISDIGSFCVKQSFVRCYVDA